MTDSKDVKTVLVNDKQTWDQYITTIKYYGDGSLNNGLARMCEEGNYEFVVKSIELGANNFNLALLEACATPHIQIVKLLITHGANNFNQSLKEACRASQLEIVKLLIAHGADNWNDGLLSACHSKKPDLEIVKLMIDKGANNFDQCLHDVSGVYYSWQLTQYFIKLGNRRLDQAFSNACAKRDKPLVQLLLQSGITKAILNHNFANTFYVSICSWHGKDFEPNFADYILGLIDVNYQSLTKAVVSAADAYCDKDANSTFKYLTTVVEAKLQPDEISAVWSAGLNELMKHKWTVLYRVQLIGLAIENGGKFSSHYRYPQHRPLVIKLVEGGIDLALLAKAMGGMHKFVKDFNFRQLMADKEQQDRYIMSEHSTYNIAMFQHIKGLGLSKKIANMICAYAN